MSRIAPLLCLIRCAAWAADAGVPADAGAARAPTTADAGAARPVPTADAGATKDENAEWKAKPVFILMDTDKVVDAYALAKPADRAKVKGLLTKVVVGTRVAGAVLLDGYELPYSRRVDVSADVLITDPEGREVVDRASLCGAQTMDPKVMLLLPLKPVFGLMFGLTDREGEYKVKITVRDNIRGAVTRLETKFLVTR